MIGSKPLATLRSFGNQFIVISVIVEVALQPGKYVYDHIRRWKYMSEHGCVIHRNARILPMNRKLKESVVIGRGSHIRGELCTFANGGKITMGEYCYLGESSRIWSDASISIGNRVLIAHNVNIFDNDTHPVDPSRRHQHFKTVILSGHPTEIDLSSSPVVIEDDAWICAGAFVLKGVRVGSRAIIAAGSVVTKDVPSGSIVAGNPAHIVRQT